MNVELWTLAISVATAVACSLCGVLLLLNREALISEGLSHAVLPGIILAFVWTRDRSSPLLLVAAGAAGLVMVLLVHALERTKLVRDDASLGVVFPALFSVGVLAASTKLGNTHFHAHCIIDGDIALAALKRWTVGDYDLGPRPFYVVAGVLVALLAFLTLFFKELKLMVFDPLLAAGCGFRPGWLHICWLALVSVTVVTTFETAGSILVVALMITPPAAAHLLCDGLGRTFVVSGLLGAVSAVGGFYVALPMAIAPAGPMAAVAGLVFLAALLGAPKRGLIAAALRRRAQRTRLHVHLVLTQLGRAPSARRGELAEMLPGIVGGLDRALRIAERSGLVTSAADGWRRTDRGAASVQGFLEEGAVS